MPIKDPKKVPMDASGKIVGMPKVEVVKNFNKKQMENPANASGNVSKSVSPNNSVDKD
jgi:hypothetical protein